jgi:hypothetical protein
MESWTSKLLKTYLKILLIIAEDSFKVKVATQLLTLHLYTQLSIKTLKIIPS